MPCFMNLGPTVEAQKELFLISLRLHVSEACAGCSFLIADNQVHSLLLKSGIPTDVYLVNLTCRHACATGYIEDTSCILDAMPKKNTRGIQLSEKKKSGIAHP
ncbi:unnamed protein product [Ilex paraguariensis]|uniref:Uncharacterized protein n=1 Tax=Ilex paraguariensis TaxID=185542 RepID=A0ABC8S6N5_9AQUA